MTNSVQFSLIRYTKLCNVFSFIIYIILGPVAQWKVAMPVPKLDRGKSPPLNHQIAPPNSYQPYKTRKPPSLFLSGRICTFSSDRVAGAVGHSFCRFFADFILFELRRAYYSRRGSKWPIHFTSPALTVEPDMSPTTRRVILPRSNDQSDPYGAPADPRVGNYTRGRIPPRKYYPGGRLGGNGTRVGGRRSEKYRLLKALQTFTAAKRYSVDNKNGSNGVLEGG